ncbi:MAG: hypothetical protein AAF597_09645 [Bacteroidota bacterium]
MWKYLFIIILTVSSLALLGQPGRGGERFERIRAAKKALLQERLALTPQESEAFFPILWNYEERIRKARRDFGSERRVDVATLQALTETEAADLLAANYKRRQEVLALEHEAEMAYLEVLPARKVVLLHQAEKEFREKLLHRLRQQRRGERKN